MIATQCNYLKELVKMCVIATKPNDVHISKETLRICFENNSDGAGFIFAHNGELKIIKGFFEFERFWNSYSKAMTNYNNPTAIIHFRITTHGKTNHYNCHPFLINKEIGFAHNGVISFVDDDKKKSDTSMFNDTILKNLPKNWINNSSIFRLIEESIGTSKLAFLTNDGDYLIANEELGQWKDGVWYSNDSFKACKWTNPYNYGYVYQPYNRGAMNIHKKKKKKKKNKQVQLLGDGVVRYNCSSCDANLSTHYEQNQGLCSTCDKEYYQI